MCTGFAHPALKKKGATVRRTHHDPKDLKKKTHLRVSTYTRYLMVPHGLFIEGPHVFEGLISTVSLWAVYKENCVITCYVHLPAVISKGSSTVSTTCRNFMQPAFEKCFYRTVHQSFARFFQLCSISFFANSMIDMIQSGKSEINQLVHWRL